MGHQSALDYDTAHTTKKYSIFCMTQTNCMSWLHQKHKKEVLQNLCVTLREMTFYEKLMQEAQEHKNRLALEVECIENHAFEIDSIQRTVISSRLELLHDFLLRRSCDPFVQDCRAIIHYSKELTKDSPLEITLRDKNFAVEANIFVKSLQTENLVQNVLGSFDKCKDYPTVFCTQTSDEHYMCQKHQKTLTYKSGLRLHELIQLQEISKSIVKDNDYTEEKDYYDESYHCDYCKKMFRSASCCEQHENECKKNYPEKEYVDESYHCDYCKKMFHSASCCEQHESECKKQ